MPLGDVTEKNLVLDSLFGAGKAAGMPTSHSLALFSGNPYDDGVEITGPGYAQVTVNNDSGWPAAADAMKSRDVTFPDPTDAWDDANAWVMFHGTAITAWEWLDDTLEIDGAGDGPVVSVTVYIPDDANVAT